MRPEIVVAIVTSASTLIAAIVSIIVNNRLIGYKVDELKKAVDKHNSVIERVFVIERDLKTSFTRIDELRADVKELQKGVH